MWQPPDRICHRPHPFEVSRLFKDTTMRRRGFTALLLTFALLPWPGLHAAPLPPIVVSMPGPGAAPYLPLELLAALGADRRAGFRLELRFFGGGPLALKDMLGGNADFTVLGMPAMAGVALSRISSGQDTLRSIAVVTQAPAFAVMVRADLRARVRKVADLHGMSIGTHSSSKAGKSTGQQVPEYLLLRANIPLEQVNFISAGQTYEDYAAALVSGAVDAVVAEEPGATHLEDAGLAFRLVDLHEPASARAHLGGRFIYTQVCADARTLAAHPDKARRLLKALRETLAWIHAHSAEDMARLLEPQNAERQALLARALRRVKPAYSADGKFSAEQLRTTQAFFRAVSADKPGAAQLEFGRLVDERWIGR
jgi:NitT/TauT family transport system substrate-binding protein